MKRRREESVRDFPLLRWEDLRAMLCDYSIACVALAVRRVLDGARVVYASHCVLRAVVVKPETWTNNRHARSHQCSERK